MAASASDYFIKATPSFSTTIGASGVSDGSTSTIPLVSVATLPTDTGVELVINRVDASGQATNNYETVRGVVSGSNITSTARGVEGTAQGWSAGTVVEYLVTADITNRLVTGLLVSHNQDGTLKSSMVLTTPQINDTSSDHQYVFAVNELAADRTVTLPLLAANDTFTFNAATQTFTNKRITKRVTAITSSATPTVNTDDCDVVDITALATAITSMTTNLSGTPTNKQLLQYEIKDDGTARGITWGSSFVAGGVALPTTTVLGKILTVLVQYSTANSLNKWRCIGSLQET